MSSEGKKNRKRDRDAAEADAAKAGVDAPVASNPAPAPPPPAPVPALPAEDTAFAAESQRARWAKYGSNVLLTTVVVVLLAGVAVWAAQGTTNGTAPFHKQANLNRDGAGELKPQSVAVLKGLPDDAGVRLVSLYPKLKKEEVANKGTDTYERVRETLEEYRRNGKGITVEMIDPIAEPARADAFVTGLADGIKKKYRPTVDAYEAFFKSVPEVVAAVREASEAERPQIDKVNDELQNWFFGQRVPAAQTEAQALATVARDASLPQPQRAQAQVRRREVQSQLQADAEIVQRFGEIGSTFGEAVRPLADIDRAVAAGLAQKFPDYAELASTVRRGVERRNPADRHGLTDVAGLLAATAESLREVAEGRGGGNVPPAAVAYAKAAVPRFEALRARVAKVDADAEDAGKLVPATNPASQPATRPAADPREELRRAISDLRSALTPKASEATLPAAVVVVGKEGTRVIDDASLWQKASAGSILSGPSARSGPPVMRFTGEQQVTSAILGVTQSARKRVVFVRGGGQGLAGNRDAPFGELAARLRAFNFEVLERDVSRDPQSPPMPDEMGRQPPPPDPNEATDAQLRDAVWVVLPVGGNPMARSMTPPLADRLRDHLAAGGAALVLAQPQQGEDLAPALKEFGVEVPAGTIVVRAKLDSAAAADEPSRLEQIRRLPFLLTLNDYGDHPITRPLQSLEGLFPILSPVRRVRVSGTDLALKDESKKTVVRSKGRKFVADDVGRFLWVRDPAGTNWQPGRYKVLSVDAEGAATLDASVAAGEAVTPTGDTSWELERDVDLPAGVTVTPILPVPTTPAAWGERDTETVFFGRTGDYPNPSFDPKSDVPGPLFGGAVAERAGGGRVVVLGTIQFAISELVREQDPRLKGKASATLFPANGELVTNSVLWLAKEDAKIGLSPAAADTPRIAAIAPGQLSFLRVGIVMVLLPLSAVAAGLLVWTTRRG